MTATEPSELEALWLACWNPVAEYLSRSDILAISHTNKTLRPVAQQSLGNYLFVRIHREQNAGDQIDAIKKVISPAYIYNIAFLDRMGNHTAKMNSPYTKALHTLRHLLCPAFITPQEIILKNLQIDISTQIFILQAPTLKRLGLHAVKFVGNSPQLPLSTLTSLSIVGSVASGVSFIQHCAQNLEELEMIEHELLNKKKPLSNLFPDVIPYLKIPYLKRIRRFRFVGLRRRKPEGGEGLDPASASTYLSKLLTGPSLTHIYITGQLHYAALLPSRKVFLPKLESVSLDAVEVLEALYTVQSFTNFTIYPQPMKFRASHAM